MSGNNWGKIKKIDLKAAIYPAILAVYLAALILVFWSALKFLSRQVGDIFGADLAEKQLLSLDLTAYGTVAGKLNLPAAVPPLPAAGAAAEIASSAPAGAIVEPAAATSSAPAPAASSSAAVNPATDESSIPNATP